MGITSSTGHWYYILIDCEFDTAKRTCVSSELEAEGSCHVMEHSWLQMVLLEVSLPSQANVS